MFVIVMVSFKGGVGKFICVVFFVIEFVCMGVDVIVLDCDFNKFLMWWVLYGLLKGVMFYSDIGCFEIVLIICVVDGDGKIVVVDLEGVVF